MPFVDVYSSRLNSQRFQDTHSADAQHDFLAQALLRIVGVEAMSDGAIPGLIGFYFGIQQIDRDAADIRAPHEHMNRWLEERNLNSQRFIVSVEHEFDRVVGAIQSLFVVFL